MGKDENGDVVAFELSDLDPEVREGLENFGATSAGLFNEEDLMAAGEELDPNSSAALLVWENVWAKPVADAIRDAGGELYDYDRVPHEVVVAAREWARQTHDDEGGLKMPLMRRGPGLVRGAARVGVAAGVAGRVRHHQDQKWAAQDQPAEEQQAPPAPQRCAGGGGEADYTAELEKLAKLRDEGVITADDFEAKKKQLLGI